MKEEILKIIIALKAKKISVSKIEKELGFSNGLIGKAAKGGTGLSEDKIEKLRDYFKSVTGVCDSPMVKTKLVVEKSGLKEKPSDESLKEIRVSNEKINKDFGAGTVMFFGDKPQQGYDVISTGSIGLDSALGIGGFPRGRMVEIYGLESSGKTTIALQVIANAQKKGLKCLLIDAENAFDPEYADALGVDVDTLQYCQPSCGEDGLEVADRKITSGEANVVVIDSVAALTPKRELEGEMGDSVMGLHARLMSQACRKMVTSVSKTNTLLIFINQIRNKIGMVFGNPEVTTGGMALQFYASIRVSITRMAQIKDGDVLLGNKTKAKVTKNKCAPPMKIAEFDINYGQGVDRTGEIIDAAVLGGIIKKSGSWFSYNEDKLGQGREQVKELLNDNPDLKEEINSQLTNINH